MQVAIKNISPDSLVVSGFVMRQGLAVSPAGNLLMLVAVTFCGLSYAEDARLARRMGG